MGGARPKAVVEDQDGLWLAKFNAPQDRWNVARVEHTMLMLARSCGLAVADSRVIDVAGRDVLLVKRFGAIILECGFIQNLPRCRGTVKRHIEAAGSHVQEVNAQAVWPGTAQWTRPPQQRHVRQKIGNEDRQKPLPYIILKLMYQFVEMEF